MRKIIFLIAFCLRQTTLLGQPQQVTTPTKSLGEALNPDGTLNPSVSGSFNAGGYQMKLSADGKPQFEAQQGIPRASSSPDDNWDDRFGSPLYVNEGNSTIQDLSAVAVSGNEVYVGGTFSKIGGTNANSIAKWDGANWSDLGGGVLYSHDGITIGIATVNVISISENGIYVGGFFTKAGNINGNTNVKSIAKWDGNIWSSLGSLGSGVENTYVGGANLGIVNAIAISGSEIYVGGQFNSAGGVSANSIAKWNGTNWEKLSTGITSPSWGYVASIAVSGNEVYVGGTFSEIGETDANSIAKWDGNIWSSLGSGVTFDEDLNLGLVKTIIIDGTDIYVGGEFRFAGGIRVNSIAKWNGSWSQLGMGVQDPWSGAPELPGYVNGMALNGGQLYIFGTFRLANGLPANHVAIWDGTSLQPLGVGLNGNVYGCANSTNGVYAVGYFTDVSGDPNADRIAFWSVALQDWNSGNGLNGTVRALVRSEGNVYAGGDFTDAGGVANADHIARWDGGKWNALGVGADGPIHAIAVSGNNVYVGGAFSRIGGIPANNIAKWNGSIWTTLGTGTNGIVHALAVKSEKVYIGGSFTFIDKTPAENFAIYDVASNSVSQAPIPGIQGTVYAIAISKNLSINDLYAGGSFRYAGSVESNNIVMWVDGRWKRIPRNSSQGLVYGLDGNVYALAVSNGGEVCAGGDFPLGFGMGATFSRFQWNAYGGLNGTVRAITIDGNDIYVGGDFNYSSNYPILPGEYALKNHITRLRDGQWERFGNAPENTGTNASVYAIAASSDKMHIGGEFTTAGGKPSLHFGRWFEPVFRKPETIAQKIDSQRLIKSAELAQNYPNPFNPTTTITFNLAQQSDVNLSVYDILGRKVVSLVQGNLKAGTHQAQFNAQTLASGVYFYRLTAGAVVETKRMLLVK